MTDERTRTNPIASNDDVRIVGYRAGDRTTVIIVHNREFAVDAIDSAMLGRDFRAAVEQYVPADLHDAVLAWLDRPDGS